MKNCLLSGIFSSKGPSSLTALSTFSQVFGDLCQGNPRMQVFPPHLGGHMTSFFPACSHFLMKMLLLAHFQYGCQPCISI